MSQLIAVAAGVLTNAAGEVLIAQRPAGKIAAGLWEFPGGKIEPGETPYCALVRELGEELGVQVRQARPLIRVSHDYSDRRVQLDTWCVTAFDGEPHGRERQALAWVRPARLREYPLLAADHPIVTALCLPTDYVFTPPDAGEQDILRHLPTLPAGALLRLRLPAWPVTRYRQLAREVIAAARPLGLRIMLDRDADMADELGADGWHASGLALMRCAPRPERPGGWWIASVHTVEDLQAARSKRFDAAVLGPVERTPTHPGAAGLGWASFAAWTASANLPVYAIGGVGPGNRGQVQALYGQGVAGISAYWSVSS
ncbi:MAG TPA: Nudix family hydrolase [Stenotrophobium sp.]|nr:Nudix family hydrolase [Stenotrophobium sp.]